MRVLASLFLSAALATPSFGQNAQISVGPAVMSFQDLARKLSVDGRTIVCASGLKESAAVVCLKKRSWSETQEILGAGLDVRFTIKPEAPNTWLMERDPAVLEEESRTRHALALFARRQMAIEIAPYLRHVDQPIHVRLERMIALQHAITQREKEDPEHKAEATQQIEKEFAEYQKDSDPFSAVAARLGNQFSISVYDSALRSPMSFLPFDINRVANVQAISQLMLREMERALQERPAPGEDGEIPTDEVEPDPFIQILQAVSRGHISAVHRLHFDPSALRVTVQQMYLLAGKYSFREGVTVQLVDGDGYAALFRNLSEEDKQKYESDQRKTKEWLKTPQGQRTFDLPRGLQVSSLSQAIEGWARNGSEVVMELAPFREDLRSMEVISDEEDAEPQPIKSISLAKLVGSEKLPWPWTFSAQKGVLLVKNPFNFLDHGQSLPMAALLALEALVKPKNEQPKIGWNLRLSEIIGFHQSVTAALNAALALGGATYRGVPIGVLTEGRFATILRRLTPRQRELLDQGIAAKEETELSMSAFSPRDLSEVAATLRAIALMSENDHSMDIVFQPDFEHILATSTLKFKRGEQEMTISLNRAVKEKGETSEVTSVTIALDARH